MGRPASSVKRARSAEKPKRPAYPDPHTDALGLSIHHVQKALEYAHLTGGKCLELHDDTIEVAHHQYPGLAGTSDQACNSIVFPLQSVHETLKNTEMSLENWAIKAKRMKYQQKPIGK